jgi:hypothetical protein
MEPFMSQVDSSLRCSYQLASSMPILIRAARQLASFHSTPFTDLCHPSFGTRRRLLMGFILIVVPSAGPTNTLIRTFNG